MKKLVAISLMICSCGLFADYPTIWNIKNDIGRPIYVDCESTRLDGFPYAKAFVGPYFLEVGQDYSHTFWDWYNEGKGLGSGSFHCVASDEYYGSPVIFIDFAAASDERVILRVTGSAIIKE